MATSLTDDPRAVESPALTEARPGAEGLRCQVVTPERTTLDEGHVPFVALPLYDGELGVLPGRAPLIGRLGYGELRIGTGATARRYFVEGGFAQVRDDVVTVLTNRAIPASEVEPSGAARELEQAQARTGTSEPERAAKSRAVDRARALVRFADRRS